jgi:serine protease SohB
LAVVIEISGPGMAWGSLSVFAEFAYTAEHLDVKNLNCRFEEMADALNHDLLNPHERKAHIKAKKKEYKQRTKEQKKGKTARSRVFVLDFDGDIRASAVEHLREEISAVVQVARAAREPGRHGPYLRPGGIAAAPAEKRRDQAHRLR